MKPEGPAGVMVVAKRMEWRVPIAGTSQMLGWEHNPPGRKERHPEDMSCYTKTQT
jgi:hypothetical protein